MLKRIAAPFLIAALAAPVAAQEVRIWPVATQANYCPAGLQPVTYDGAISCGTTTETMTYQQAIREPGRRHSVRDYCPEGAKGCR